MTDEKLFLDILRSRRAATHYTPIDLESLYRKRWYTFKPCALGPQDRAAFVFRHSQVVQEMKDRGLEPRGTFHSRCESFVSGVL